MGDNMNYCMNSNELESLLLFYLNDKAVENTTLKSLVENAIHWQDKLLCLTFSFARILEKRRSLPSLTQMMIPILFSLPEKMFIDIQECDDDYVDYMLRHEHSGEIELENSLMTVAKQLSEYCYGKETLRY